MSKSFVLSLLLLVSVMPVSAMNNDVEAADTAFLQNNSSVVSVASDAKNESVTRTELESLKEEVRYSRIALWQVLAIQVVIGTWIFLPTIWSDVVGLLN